LEAVPERTYVLTSLGEDILKSIDEKDKPPVQNRPTRRRAKDDAEVASQTHSADQGPTAPEVIPSRADLPDETLPDETRPKGKDLSGVPTTLEGLFSTGEEKSAHEVLGLLVDSHIKEAEAILGRTNLQRHEILVISRALHVARHGIGGPPGSPFDRPKPWVSQFVLDILRALPSIDGASRKQFVEAWQSAQERLRREQESKEGAQERLVRA
jgi:hypothetical protein